MAGARDPENYYGILKLKPGADEAAIKAAYRKRVKDLHPDTNRNPRAVEQFHKLQQAYEVLTDAKKRAAYDQASRRGAEALKTFREAARRAARAHTGKSRAKTDAGPSAGKTTGTGSTAGGSSGAGSAKAGPSATRTQSQPPPKQPPPKSTPNGDPAQQAPRAEAAAFPPMACSVCKQVTAQPRFAEYTAIRAKRGKVQRLIFDGVFCRTCADKVALKASLISWFAGWWAWPNGPRATLAAIWSNMKGGVLPRARNARLLLEQARAFKARNDARLARELAGQALGFAPDDATRNEITAFIASLSRHLDGPRQRLKNRWKSPGLMPFAHLAPGAILLAICSIAVSLLLG